MVANLQAGSSENAVTVLAVAVVEQKNDGVGVTSLLTLIWADWPLGNHSQQLVPARSLHLAHTSYSPDLKLKQFGI